MKSMMERLSPGRAPNGGPATERYFSRTGRDASEHGGFAA